MKKAPQDSEANCSLETLQVELLQQNIAAYLDYPGFLALCFTSRRLREILASENQSQLLQFLFSPLLTKGQKRDKKIDCIISRLSDQKDKSEVFIALQIKLRKFYEKIRSSEDAAVKMHYDSVVEYTKQYFGLLGYFHPKLLFSIEDGSDKIKKDEYLILIFVIEQLVNTVYPGLIICNANFDFTSAIPSINATEVANIKKLRNGKFSQEEIVDAQESCECLMARLQTKPPRQVRSCTLF
jgi:hypothetical protein